MSARKADGAGSISHVTVTARQTRLTLSPDAVVYHNRGIEFRSASPFSPWAEMVLTLRCAHEGTQLHCSGVVISCTGNKHTGYHVSMVFTGLSKQAEARLRVMTFAQLR